MIYDRDGKTLWIADETGNRRPAESWDELKRMPRGAGIPDWWLEAREPGWTPPELVGWENGRPPSLGSGRSLLTMTEADHRALGASGGSSGSDSGGGAGTKLGCGGACQEQYDTATGRYTGNKGGSTGGGSTQDKGGGKTGGAKTPAPKSAPAKAPAPQAQPVTYHKAAGADRTPPNYNKRAGADSTPWPDSDPPVPPGVDLDKNIQEAEAHEGDILWFYGKVQSGHPWDYKNVQGLKGTERIEDFGNFNYGATGAAMGLSDELLYRAAGAKQALDHLKDGKYSGIMKPPYGDDQRDAAMIRRGIEYYRRQETM